jgi:Tol biopolymer transport system component/DNA-binding winged helix-turn-helix (wHTH) protein
MINNEHGAMAYEFGPFRLEPGDYLLTRSGDPVAVPPKVFELLVVLVQHHGHTVEKESLMQTLWPNVTVEESSLTQLVFQLRKTLGEKTSQQHYIETVSKRGYRFVADVRVRGDTELVTPQSEKHFGLDDGKEVEIQTLADESRLEPSQDISGHGPRRSNTEVSVPAPKFIRWTIAGTIALGAGLLAIGLIKWFPRRDMNQSGFPFENVNIRKLTASGKAILPALSPDGKVTAYVVDDSGRQAIWVRQIATTSRVQITEPAEKLIQSLIFARDGQSLYFVEKQKNLTSGSLYQIPVFGGTPRKVLDNVHGPISFSPDGKQFAFIRGNVIEGDTNLVIATTEGDGIQTLAVRKRPDFFSRYAVAWSPDGRAIACAAGRSDLNISLRQIITVGVSDGRETPLGVQSWAEIGEVAWLRDGTGIIVNALPRDSPIFAFQLWHLAYPSGTAQKLFRDLVNYEGVSLATQSDVIALGRSDRVSKIWIAPADATSDARQILSSMSDNYSESFGLSWTSSGKIVYSSHGGGNSDIWIMDADGRNQRQLTFDPEREFWPVVSPDDRFIVFTSQGPNGVHLWRIDIDGGNRRKLTQGQGESFPSFSPDGRSIFFSSMEPGWPVVGKVSIDGGATVMLTQTRSARPVVSPDGKLIACLYFDDALARLVVAVIPVEGGEPIKRFSDLPAPNWSLLQWTPDGQGLAYIATTQGVSNVWVQPISGGSPRQLTEFREDRIYRFAWSRDGKSMAIDRGININDVILLSSSQ